MPQYRYRCNDCAHETRRIRSAELREQPVACEACGGPTELMVRSISTIARETVDPYRKISLTVGHRENIEKRAKQHFIERGEMDELIQKHGLEHAIRKGWVTPDGKTKKMLDLK